MGWIDPEHIPKIADDWRYARLIRMTRTLLEERVPACGNCSGGTVTITDDSGQQTTVTCGACDGTGSVGSLQDNEDNGRADGS